MGMRGYQRVGLGGESAGPVRHVVECIVLLNRLFCEMCELPAAVLRTWRRVYSFQKRDSLID